jgi:hypothetical protein
MASMSHAMNTYVFGEPDAPLKDLQLSAEGSQIGQKATLKNLNPVRIPLNDHSGHVDAGQVLAEVLRPCRRARGTGRGRGALFCS